MLATATSDRDPLALALRRKAQTGGTGGTEDRELAAGEGWRAVDIVCTSGPQDRPFEERHLAASVSLVVAGNFVYRSQRGRSLLSPGTLLLGSEGDAFECSHQHGEGDRCVSFQFDTALFERLAYDAGAREARFGCDRLPPLRTLAPLCVRARAAVERHEWLEEVALELAGAALGTARQGDPAGTAPSASDQHRIARVVRQLGAEVGAAHALADLAHTAGLSRYHFLRTFRRVTGVTPHQWLLRARLREAAQRLLATREPITQIALAVGFDDLSNFVRSFRAEFGRSPRRYRAGQ